MTTIGVGIDIKIYLVYLLSFREYFLQLDIMPTGKHFKLGIPVEIVIGTLPLQSVSQPTMQLSTAPYQSNMPLNHMNEEATLSIAMTQPVIPKTKQSFNNKGKVSI